MTIFKLQAGERVELPMGTWNPLKETKRGTRVVRSEFQTWEITGRHPVWNMVQLHRLSTDHTIEDRMAVEVEFVGPYPDGYCRFKESNLGALVLGDHVRLVTISHNPVDPEGIFPEGIYFAEPFGTEWGFFGFPRNATPDERSALMGLYKAAGKMFDKVPIALGPVGEVSLTNMYLDYGNLWRGPDDVLPSDEVDGLSLS